MEDCLFCKIANKEIESDIVFENRTVIVFKDISPVAPVHLVAIPKKHISSIMEIGKMDCFEIEDIMKTIVLVASDMGLEKNGFRVVTNTGPDAGQSVGHLHFHIMGERKFLWPPG
ncbi:MAG: histidine triad nucleotide-binding protein [Actinobacteria bacterium]|nr:histidine triad nucleotide-binding protein [Actinomycetota bacterium]